MTKLSIYRSISFCTWSNGPAIRVYTNSPICESIL